MKEQSSQRLNRSFGLVMAAGLLGLAFFRYIWVGAIVWWLVGAGLGFLAGGLFVPTWLEPVRRAWMKLAAVLGAVNSRILLTLVFVGLVTPLAILLRLFGKQPIQAKICKTASTYWQQRRPEEFTPQRMERQF